MRKMHPTNCVVKVCTGADVCGKVYTVKYALGKGS